MEAQQLAVKPEDTQKVFREVAERSARIIGEFAQRHVANSISAAVTDELGIAKAYMDLYARMLANPYVLASASANLMMDYVRLWQSSWLRMFGLQAPPAVAPAKGDSRF